MPGRDLAVKVGVSILAAAVLRRALRVLRSDGARADPRTSHPEAVEGRVDGEEPDEEAVVRLSMEMAAVRDQLPRSGEVSVPAERFRELIDQHEMLLRRFKQQRASGSSVIMSRLKSAGSADVDDQFRDFISREYDIDENERRVCEDAVTALRRHSQDRINEEMRRHVHIAQSRVAKQSSVLMEAATDARVDMSRTPAAQQELLGVLRSLSMWMFDSFALSALTRHPIVHVGTQILESELNVTASLALDATKLRSFLLAINSSYRDTPYHCALHGADVAQTTYYFLTKGKAGENMSKLEQTAAIVAALCHDVGHPGLTAPFLVAVEDPLAIRYNDNSPLENMHAAITFGTMQKEENSFLTCSKEQYRIFRRIIITAILGTDNSMHGEIMLKLDGFSEMDNALEKCMIKVSVALHAADVSNPAKDWVAYQKWTERLMEEFYLQGDAERSRGMEVTPGFDRLQPMPRPRFQLSFIRGLVEPLFKSLERNLGLDVKKPLEQLSRNASVWESQLDGLGGED